MGVDTQFNPQNPGILNCYITIVIVINYDDMKTEKGYVREDLLEDGVVCYTKADLIAEEILMALAEDPSKTWIGEIRLSSSEEASLNNSAHYARKLHLYVQEINPANRGV
ncbi:MAG: hypothetical protein NC084_06225 [Bacteroides sp.]|nr:hypothetical protein [Eubacterium sp.]MCM1418178.1 hypothetical protein [Roseburia sp.]MCM1462297.1 hypothetical protein [Bacteroides sp.]